MHNTLNKTIAKIYSTHYHVSMTVYVIVLSGVIGLLTAWFHMMSARDPQCSVHKINGKLQTMRNELFFYVSREHIFAGDIVHVPNNKDFYGFFRDKIHSL